MKSSVPAIAPLLRSDVQGNLLAALLLFPERQLTLTELTMCLNSSAPTVHREVERLVASGFLLEHRSGRNRYVRANVAHPLFAPVVQIIGYSYGPGAVLPRLLTSVDGIDHAYIYGSWAARMAGVEGNDPADIEVVLVGSPDRAQLFDVAREAQRVLRREVNFQVVTPVQWEDAADPFLATVRSRALHELSLVTT